MAKKNFDIDETTTVVEEPVSVETSFDIPVTPDIKEDEPKGKTVAGLSSAELADPNSISVTVADQVVPIIILFGPTSCGKTMTLIRLTRFLKTHGFAVNPIKSFRPTYDEHYQKLCKDFNRLVDSDDAAFGTSMISFMLVEVLTSTGKRICQILEAPGEYYFSPSDPSKPFPNYVNRIFSLPNRKIYLFMVEPNWMNESDRRAYVTRISGLKQYNMNPRDKAIFLYNKVDESPYVISPGVVNLQGVKTDIANMYPGIFTKFANVNPITRLFRPYNCGLIPFSNGFFNYAALADGTQKKTYVQGPDAYPGNLWNRLMKLIRG